MFCVPLMARAPDQPPEAVHEVASVADHVNVLDPPLAIDVGFAVSVVTGIGGGADMRPPRSSLRVAVPPRPTQLSVKFFDACSGPPSFVPSLACARPVAGGLAALRIRGRP